MPLISWSQSNIVNPTYAGGDRHLEFMTAMGTLLGTLTHWDIETTDLSAVGGAYVIKPKNVSAYPNQRIIIQTTSTGITGGGTTKYADPYDSASTNETKTVGIGYCRDVTGGTYTSFDSANPFGLADTSQWWLYMIASDALGTLNDAIDHMYVVECADGLAMFFNKTATASWWGWCAGYLMEDISGTPFSMCATSGPTVISSTFWGSTNAWMDGSGANDTNASFQAWKGTARDRVTKISTRTVAAPQLTTSNNTRVHIPRNYRYVTVPLNFAGNLRQIRMGEDQLTRTQLSSGGGALQSTLFAPTLSSVADSLAFDEG
tara:strand:+ start:415 stop:1368 length:954 start_codon:yes stop_codon:yes gene_type:complete